MTINEEYSRIVHTNLFSDKAYEVCDAVIGQLSDGWGENNSRYNTYWMFGRVMRNPNGEVVIAISNKDYMFNTAFSRNIYTNNGFKNMSDNDVKAFFAKMIKKTAMMELRDNNVSSSYWKRHNIDFKSSYLNYKLEISIAEVYAIYEMLLGRNITSTKYAESVIQNAIGIKRSEADTNKAKEIAEKREELEKNYLNRRSEIDKAEKAEIAAIQTKYVDQRNNLLKEYREAIKEFDNM